MFCISREDGNASSQSSVTLGPTFSLISSGHSIMSSPAVTKTASGRTVRRPPGATYITDEGLFLICYLYFIRQLYDLNYSNLC